MTNRWEVLAALVDHARDDNSELVRKLIIEMNALERRRTTLGVGEFLDAMYFHIASAYTYPLPDPERADDV